MLDLEIGGMGYLAKALFKSLFFLIVATISLLLMSTKRPEIPIFRFAVLIYLFSVLVFYFNQNSFIDDFEKEKIVVRGKFCGLKGRVLFYRVCVDDEWYRSHKKGIDMLDDVILSFAWTELPTGCVEMHYNLKRVGNNGLKYIRVGRLKEISCDS